MHLIQLFNLVALLFIVPLGLKSLLTQDYNIALPLLGVAILTVFNYLYLKKSKNEAFASHFLSCVFLILMIYLLYTGGVNNTGPLWISSLPIIVFFLLGLKKGFYYIFIFLILGSIILFVPFDFGLKATYPQDFNLRVILSFLLVTFLSAMYEYNNSTSFDTMQTLKEELEYISTRDHLTSLYNRRGYEKHIQSIQNPQGVVLMCDMDLFKKVNDNYGHDTGDFVLQEVAHAIQSMLRKEDIAVRWGGEEFFVFLPLTSMEDGSLVAEKIRQSIENLSLVYNGHSIKITLSIGMEEVSDTITLANAISHADTAMYQAKKAGRNSTVIFTAS
jgi:diguanylate cyclase (GGDEF)-like protein